MSPKMISPIKKIPKKIDRDEFLKPKKINDIKKQQYTYTYLMEQMCDYIRKLDKNVLKQGIRIWTPFTTDQGVLLQEGFGYIIKDEGVMDEHDILIKGGKLSPYDAIAKAMSKHYDKQHLEIIERYLKLKPFPKNQFTLLNFNGKYIIKEFDTFIKKIWPKPPQDLKGKTQQKKERARMALNYFSAILAFGEPYRREGNLTDSLDLISDLIVNYKSPTNTPIKAFLCKDGSKQHRLTMTGCSEELRNTKFNNSGIMKKKKKKKKTKIKPRSNSSSSLDDEDEILDGNLKSAESDIIKEAQREDNFDDPEMMPKNQRQKYMPKVPNGDLMEQFSAKKTRRNSIKIQKKEMKEERETSTDSDTDSLEMKMSTKSSRNSSLNNINNNRSMSEEKEISEIKEKESYSENKQTTKSTSPISYMEEEENEIFHSTPSHRPYTLHRIKTTKKKKATKKRKNKP